MHVIFERLRKHELKLKPTKCDLFRTELIYLAHHVSKDGVKPPRRMSLSSLPAHLLRPTLTSNPLQVSWVTTGISLKDSHT